MTNKRHFNETYGSNTLSGLKTNAVSAELGGDYPLLIGIHGGTYTSTYFDVPGFSLLDRAEKLGIPTISIDRPSYGETTALAPQDSTIAKTAEWLDGIIGDIWQRHGGHARGVFIIGHSIGGAMAVSIAARQPSWPLLGIAVSGVGLLTPPESGKQWAALPDIPLILLPSEQKDHVMFGPAWTFHPDAPARSHIADTTAPRAELIDIVSTWHAEVHDIAAKVKVPLHYRQGEFDRLWITGSEQVAGFGAAFVNSPMVDAAEFSHVGHCIDFHRLGAAFQLEQLAFALNCCVQKEH